ncbi:MAG TPA: ParB/RepB/Spo0J family partition protein [Pyrinomonadaceae bacterium]|nr:ParB/RepB/Spo0J family partition protein [Pyrinomonadaceae bacterium]
MEKQLEYIDISNIDVSPLPSQERRRKRFDARSIEELAESIKRHGLVNPITVRRVGDRAEIVAGERRFLAARSAGLESIAAVVLELDDTAAAEIQLIENGQRQDQHPLDEGFDFADMKALLGFDEQEIAHRIGKTLGFVRNRIKLTELHEDVRASLESDQLPIGHALEIAKYPVRDQPEIVKLAVSHSYAGSGVRPLSTLIAEIERQYLLNLNRAPFPISSMELRSDEMPCLACAERTGAQPDLFEDNFGDADRCLNRRCWNAKTDRFVQIARLKVAEEIAAENGSDPAESLRDVPELSSNWYVSREEAKGRDLVGRDFYREVGEKPCDRMKQGVFVDGEKVGQTALICRDKTCSTHWSAGQSSLASKTPEDDSENRKIRKEEIFNAKVAEAVRRRVLKAASEKIDQFSFGELAFFSDLLARYWECLRFHDDYAARTCLECLGVETEPYTFKSSIPSLSATLQNRLLFLMTYAEKDQIGKHGAWDWTPQREIKSRAADWGVDYAVLDAEERLAQAPPKHKDVFRHYLHELQAGNEPLVPRIYSDKWRP